MNRLSIKIILLLTACMMLFSCVAGSQFDRNFWNRTLRVDLNIVNDGPERGVTIDSLFLFDGWAGRRVNLDSLPYPYSLTYTLVDALGDTIYRDSKHVDSGQQVKSYLNLPLPRRDARLLIEIYGMEEMAKLSSEHELSRREIRTRARQIKPAANVMSLQKSDWPTPITLTILPDGYTTGELPEFYAATQSFTDSLFSNEAFARYRNRFIVNVVDLPSDDSGISSPSKGEMRSTALGSHYDSYGMERLVTLSDVMRIPQSLRGIPSGHVVILINSNVYGGGGAYNEYCIGYTGDSRSTLVQIHEFGHSFGNLGDECEEGFEGTYSSNREPDEPNITTLHDFGSKWQNLVDSGEATLIEGAGYQSKGVWRGSENCLMRSVEDRKFCPVCTQALMKLIAFYTE